MIGVDGQTDGSIKSNPVVFAKVAQTIFSKREKVVCFQVTGWDYIVVSLTTR